MKTLRNAVKAVALGLLFALPFAAAQALVFWHLDGSLFQSILVFICWFMAVSPLPGLRVLASFPGYPRSYGLGLPQRPTVKKKSRHFTMAVGVFCMLGTTALFVGTIAVANLWAAAIAALTTMLFGFRVLGWLRAIPRLQSDLGNSISQLKPESIIYTGRSDGGPYQILQWLPTIQKSTKNVLIVTRHASAAAYLAKALPVGTPIISCPKNADLDHVMHSGARIVFYVNSVSSNSTVVNYRSLHHVYLGHGDSDKEISAHPVHRMYDSVFVSGQAALDRYVAQNIPLDKGQAAIVGRPQLADIVPTTGHGPITTIMYAPTWSGYNKASSLSSLDRALPFVQDCLNRGMRVIFRPHPFSLTRAPDQGLVTEIDRLLETAGAKHMQSSEASNESLHVLFNQSDALLTDISSMIVEFLPTQKPVTVLVDANDIDRYHDEYPSTRATYLATSPDSLVWHQMLDTDPMAARRTSEATRYVADISGERFAGAVDDILCRTPPVDG
ncbi:CDP-glycerol glycerophosphotransferase family protein [Paeniglutamicibacter sp. NPDC091659]|uniref:CDP-glycerol glycerophosphotransferase family protein n=1 Tax=Paeniglutamicibacter sp. NPDC091659 TaxID=3364389 RepID=UPI00380AF425